MLSKIKFFFISVIIFFFITNTISSESSNFMSLKNNKVNLRHGPSFDHPIKFIYKKKYLPVVIIDKSETWRKVKDLQNNSGWVHISQLSRKRSVLFIKDEVLIFKKPTTYSRPIYKIGKLEVAVVKECSLNWCNVKNNLFSGWVKKNSLWGLNKNEIMN